MNSHLSPPIRGARDFYPQELSIRNWLFAKWREVAKSFGYEEIDGPILENFDLFAVKSGEELVNQQTYSLTDRDGKKLAIRPELTPTYSRLIARKFGQLTLPLRWMMFGNVWRYEKPQTGRSRDFWQWEVNIVGGEENMADAEVIALAAKSLESIGLTSKDVIFRLNDRRFMQQTLAEIGIEDQLYTQTLKAIDKKERLPWPEYEAWLKEIGLTPSQIMNLEEFLSRPKFALYPKLVKLFDLLKQYGVADWVRYDPLIVRGLTYYTGTVFECFDQKMDLRSIFGGGRFDDLVETFGGPKVPAVGFAMGDVVITELLRRLNKLPHLSPTPTRLLVTVFSPDLLPVTVTLTVTLRSKGINVELYPDPAVKLDKQLKYASAKGIPFVAILGPEEAAKNLISLKNMSTGEQKLLPASQLPDELAPR